MNNFSLLLSHSGIGGSLGDNLINCLCYADDLCLIALSSAGMQKLLNTCDAYATSYQLSYNATKSFSLCFKPNLIRITPPSFVLGKHVIPAVDTCKYLGIIVSETNCDNDLKGKCESTMQTLTHYHENLVTVLQMSNVVCLNRIVLQYIVLLCGLTAPLQL